MYPFAMKDLQKRCLFYQNGTNIYIYGPWDGASHMKLCIIPPNPTCVAKMFKLLFVGKGNETKVPRDWLMSINASFNLYFKLK